MWVGAIFAGYVWKFWESGVGGPGRVWVGEWDLAVMDLWEKEIRISEGDNCLAEYARHLMGESIASYKVRVRGMVRVGLEKWGKWKALSSCFTQIE